jgi:hypothetical protein
VLTNGKAVSSELLKRIVPNPETGDVAVSVFRSGETREYTLKLGMSAAVKLQQRRKRALGEIVQGFGNMDIEDMRDVLFVLVQRHHKDEIKTFEQAEELLEDMTAPLFFAAFKALMEYGAAEGAEANPPAPAPIPTGDSSTSSAGGPG